MRNISARSKSLTSSICLLYLQSGRTNRASEHPHCSETIIQSLIIDQYADQHGNRGESGWWQAPSPIDRKQSLVASYQMNSFALSRLSYPSSTCTTRIFFIVTGDNWPIGI